MNWEDYPFTQEKFEEVIAKFEWFVLPVLFDGDTAPVDQLVLGWGPNLYGDLVVYVRGIHDFEVRKVPYNRVTGIREALLG